MATKVTTNRLEKRRKLTSSSQRLVIVLVGLPGRGKSFISRKLSSFLNWRGVTCKVFNVGKYRREAQAGLAQQQKDNTERTKSGACNANFFDQNNEEAIRIRQLAADLALKDMLNWLDEVGEEEELYMSNTPHSPRRAVARERTAIFDATNSTKARRKWILEECTSIEKRADKPTGIVFVETICDDEELLEENFRFKVINSPDFRGMTEVEAITDLRERVKKYEEQYETMTDDSLSYIKIFNLSSKLLANNIYGRMSKAVVPALMAWNIGTRPVWICRAGETGALDPEINGDNATTKRNKHAMHLNQRGHQFRKALSQFVLDEGRKFVEERSKHFAPSFKTGTSISGLQSEIPEGETNLPFPCKIMSSTMPRSVETVEWELPYQVDVLSALNPLDKGDFAGLELEQIREMDPGWYSRLEYDSCGTRFPGGECYRDLVSRLESCVIDMEQQICPVMVVSHVSVIQVLLAYFRNSPLEDCTSIEVPMHTVIKLTPSRGGGWVDEFISLLPDDDKENNEYCSSGDDGETNRRPPQIAQTPIWGDHCSFKRKVSSPM